MTEKYIICGDQPYYPWVDTYETLKEAEKEFNDTYDDEEENVYLVKIIKTKKKR